MGQSQSDPVMCKLVRAHVGREIENQTAKLALIIVRVQGMNCGQELFHVKQACVVAASMLLSEM
jgi:hypothetical protein